MKRIFLFYMALWMLLGSLLLGALDTHAEPSFPIVRDQGEYEVEIYPKQHRLKVLLHGSVFKTYRIAVGTYSTPTPIGEYTIVYKGENWGPSFGPRWLGLNVPWGNYGIHGTNQPHSLGQHLSHGCIRMRNADVIELYRLIPIGTKVTIYGHVLGEANKEPRKLAEGDVGGDVQLIQSRLKSAGYFKGECNGKFRSDTTRALKKFQQEQRIPSNGVVSAEVYNQLGLLE